MKNKLADNCSEIQNSYNQIIKEDTEIKHLKKEDIPQIKEVQFWDLLTQLRTNKSAVGGNLPAKVDKECASYISEPLTHVYNASLNQGEYPVPKIHPVEKLAK